MARIYTDASFHPQSKVAVLGYMKDDVINYFKLDNTTNTEAEIRCIILTLNLLDEQNDYILYTDCKTATDLINKPRFNKQIYYEFLEIIKRKPNVKLLHIEGHKKKCNKNEVDIEFSKLDKAVRLQLRNIIRN